MKEYEVYVNRSVNIPTKITALGKRLIRVKKSSKSPIDKWSEVQRDYQDKELQEHLAKGGNYGIVLGKGLIVVDCDSEERVKQAQGLPETFTVKTSRGIHLYYYSDEVKTCKVESLDILSDGCMVIGPDSKHPGGSRYTVLNNADIITVSSKQLTSQFNILEQELTTKTMTTTNTIIQSQSNSQGNSTIEEEIDIFSDERFQSLEYYIREGLSFLEINDISKVKVVKRSVGKNYREYYLAKGNVARSPEEFVADNIDILLSKSAVKGIRKVGKGNGGNHWHIIVYRVSENYYATTRVSEERYYELLNEDEESIIDRTPEFREAYKSKLNNLRRGNKTAEIIEDLIKGVVNKKVDDKLMLHLCYKAVEIGKTDEELVNMHKNYFKERYDEEETKAQITYARKKVARERAQQEHREAATGST